METLTRSRLVEAMKQQSGFTHAKSQYVVETIIRLMKNRLALGEDILIKNFGKFQVVKKNSRKGRNPATGEDLMLDARTVLTFKCAGSFRKRLNGK